MSGPALRVLHPIQWPTWSGPHGEAVALHHHFLERGWSLHVIIPPDAREPLQRLTAEGVPVVVHPLTRLRSTRSLAFWIAFPWRFARDVSFLRRYIRENDIDVVEGSSVNVQAAVAGRLTNAAVVWRISDYIAPGPVRWMVSVALLHLADLVLVTGHSLFKYYRPLRRLRSRAVVYHPPVNVEHIAAATRPLRSGRKRLTIGTIANINPDKGLEYFVEAAGRLSSDDRLQWIAIGAESEVHRDYARRLRARVRELELSDRFNFCGPTQDVVGALSQIDVFVLSSVREGSPSTLLEAMAAGRPIIATDVGSVGEVVVHGLTGLMVPSRDSRALADAVLSLASDEATRLAMGHAGQERASREFASSSALATRVAVCRVAAERASRRHR